MERNYLKDYFMKEEHDFTKVLRVDITNEEKIKKVRNDIRDITKMLEEKSQELHKELEKEYNKNFEPIVTKNVIEYRGRNGNHYFDLESGLVEENTDNCNTFCVDTKVGEKNIVVGYNYDLASIIVNTYKYSINSDNTKIKTKLLEEYIVPFMEKDIYGLRIGNNEPFKLDYNWSVESSLSYIKDNDFINKLFNIDYKGKKNLKDLRDYYKRNKSFEIIVKNAPSEIVDSLLTLDVEESMPIHKIIGVSQETYNKAIKLGIIKDLIENKEIISGAKNDQYRITKTENEWLDYIEEIKSYEEDLQFYDIKVGFSYYSSRDSLLKTLLENYTSSRYAFSEYYSLGKFTNYVIQETINQGYTSIVTFIQELGDYLNMCKSDNIIPTLYSSYLKQTHDITSRNHKIKVEKESEDIFKSRYKDFKTYKKDGFMVLAPTCTDDLKKEGDNLNHCVASYIKRVIDGNCLIYFLRKQEDKSLITFEVRNNTIVQVRGSHNRKPSEKETKILESFAKDRDMEVRF